MPKGSFFLFMELPPTCTLSDVSTHKSSFFNYYLKHEYLFSLIEILTLGLSYLIDIRRFKRDKRIFFFTFFCIDPEEWGLLEEEKEGL